MNDTYHGPNIDLSRVISSVQATTQALNNLNQTLNAAAAALEGTTEITTALEAINTTLSSPIFNPIGPVEIGNNLPANYANLMLAGVDSNPSIAHLGDVLAAFNGSSSATALVFGVATTSPNPAWIQTRNWYADSVQDLLVNPVGGGVAINTPISGLLAGLNSGVQVGANWSNGASYSPPGNTNALSQLTLSSSSAYSSALTSYVRTSPISVGTALGVSSYAFADNSAAIGAWPVYTEGHRLTDLDYAYGLGEAAVVNRNSNVAEINPINIPGSHGPTIGLTLEVGNDAPISDYTEYSASVGLMFQSNFDASQINAHGFAHGIVFRYEALDATLFNPPDAIALAGNTYKHAISWWSSGTNRAWLIYSDAASGNNTLELKLDTASFSSAVSTPAIAYASLPAAPTVGTIACVNNSSVNTWGGTADGAGGNKVLVWWNGSVWSVIGK